MLAAVRSCFLLVVATTCILASVAGSAQVNGVPASVTSLGFGGKTTPNGVRASVTSLGPNGYPNGWPVYGACCVDFFMPGNPNSVPFSGHRHDRKDKNKDKNKNKDFAGGVIEPVYASYGVVPYGVPYAQDADDSRDNDNDNDNLEDGPDADAGQSGGMRSGGPRSGRARGNGADISGPPVYAGPIREEEPVVAQPSTVLIFRDGHRYEVLNYAVVGDTLFDFGSERTHKILLADLDLPATRKANDDRGVDFQVPATSARQ